MFPSTKWLKHNFKTIYYLGKTFGVFHFSLYENNSNLKTLIENACSLCFVVYLIITLTLEIYNACYKTDGVLIKNKNAFHRPILIMFCFIKFCVDYIWYIFNRNKIKHILNEIGTHSNELSIKCKNKAVNMQVIAVIVSCAIVWIVLISLNIDIGSNFLTSGCVEEIIVIGITNYIIYNILKLIKQMFILLNINLNNISTLLDTNTVILTIRKCTKTHFVYAKLANKLNSVFALPLLGNSLALFVFITIYTYQVINNTEYLSFSLQQICDFSKECIMDLLLALQFVLMVYSWDSLAKEANQTGLLLHKFWIKFQRSKQITNYHQEQIDTISLQLLQNKIKFTVCRFVDLDWSLLHLVIQTVAMYLIWLIQLKT